MPEDINELERDLLWYTWCVNCLSQGTVQQRYYMDKAEAVIARINAIKAA